MTGTAKTNPNEIRHLLLMRHAKSDWGDMSLSDHDRPLNARGSRDAPRMARWIAEIGYVPDLVLSSSSQRTRDTMELMNQTWSREVQASFCHSLYLAAPETISRTIQSDGCGVGCLMVLAHNPGISHFASLLAQQSIDMPTAAIAVFEVLLNDWSQLSAHGPAKLIDYMRPKAL